jgi:hypothetical protein
MKKLLFLTAMLLTINVSAQWKYETIDNGFDAAYRVAHCMSITNNGILKLENVDGNATILYVAVPAVCSDYVKVDAVFLVNGEWVKYQFFTDVKQSSTTSYKYVLLGETIAEAVGETIFSSATKCKVRIHDTKCDDVDIYEFNMTNSAAALKFMKQGYQ